MNDKPVFKILGLFGIMAAVAVIMVTILNTPLAPHLQVTPPAAQINASPPVREEQVAAQSSALTRIVAPLTQQDEGLCGGKGQLTLLVSGISRVRHRHEHGVGAVRLVGVDYDAGEVKILAMPPELWVQSPELEDEGIPATELTKVYLFAKEFATGSEKVVDFKATRVLAQTLADNFEFVPDRYATLDPQVFADIVDELGGVVIDVPMDLDATDEGYGTFEAGEQLMDGLGALNYFSILRPNDQPAPDEWARFKRQNQVARATMQAMLDPGNWVNLPDLIKDFRKLITTDLSVNQLMELRCMVEQVDDAAELLEVTPEMVTVDAQGRQIPDVEAIKDLIAQLPGAQE